MSRPVDINLTNSNIPDPTPEELEQFAARAIQVLDRSHIIDRFRVEGAPENIHYEWHKDDPLTHARLTAKGFVTDDDLAKKSGFVHTDGAGNPRIADVRLYKIHKAKYEILQRVEEERVKRAQDPRRVERDFLDTLKSEGGFDKTITESSVEAVKGIQFAITPNKKE